MNRLNGWQRLWVVMAILWTLVVGVLSWQSWPKMRSSAPLTPAEFARIIKAKYPSYASVPDDVLVAKMLEKYEVVYTGADGVEHVFPPGLDPKKAAGIVAGKVQPPSALDVTTERTSAVRGALVLWLVPPVALYVLGCSVVWVYRGFAGGGAR